MPLVHVHCVYAVGAAHDPECLSGLAHLCEHLGLRSQAQDGFPPRRPLAAAVTRLDRTSFFQTRPADQLEDALLAEACRLNLREASAESLASERGILLREFAESRTHEPSPLEHLSGLLFSGGHGYRKSTEGTPEGVSSVERSDASVFLEHYRPETAVIAVVGDVRRERAEELVEKTLGAVSPPAGTGVPQAVTVDSSSFGGHAAVPSRVPTCRAYAACLLPPFGARERGAALLAARCLGVGRASLLARELVRRRQVARRVWTHVSKLRSTTLLAFAAEGAPGVSADRLRHEMVEVLGTIAREGIPKLILERQRKKALTDLYAFLEAPGIRAEKLAVATAFVDNPRQPAEDAERMNQLGSDEVHDSIAFLQDPGRLATLAVGNGASR
ncbi:MAG: insulinase family protein [Acidobacteriota bacterium]